MSNIDWVNKIVTWDDTNALGLYQGWVDELLADGYSLIDKRSSPGHRQIDADLYARRNTKEMQDRIDALEAALTEIRDIAKVSNGGEFYVMLADRVLPGDEK